MSINKFTTLLDLSRQAKIITGETATFDGKIEVGIPFSGYPTGVDTGTTVSLGVSIYTRVPFLVVIQQHVI
jgi:hypothetical protein